MSKIDVVFIHPNASKKIYQELSENFSAIEPPIWCGMLAQHCRSHGFEAAIIDCEAMHYNDGEAIHVINGLKPKLACFVVYGQQPSASTQNMEGATSLSKRLKESCPWIKIMFIGGHVSALPYETMEKHPEIDYLARNEGVYTVSLLLHALGKNIEQNVSGLMWRSNGAIVINNKDYINVPQDRMGMDLPGIAWDLLPMNKYRTALWHAEYKEENRSPFGSLYTSLGCQFSCSFCCINAPFGGSSFRYWNPKIMIKEFDKLAAMGVEYLKIADELFIYNKKHFLELCALLKERNYGFKFWCYGRVDCTKEEYLKPLKDAGCVYIGLGIESASQRVRKDVRKGSYEEVDIRNVVKTIRDHGINVAANYIFGLREDDMDTMKETFDLALELNTEMANFYCAIPYPGSQLYRDAVISNTKLPLRYSGYSQHSYDFLPLPTKYVQSHDVLAFRDKAFLDYYTNENFLSMIKNKFGESSVQNINRMTQIKLKRELLGHAN